MHVHRLVREFAAPTHKVWMYMKVKHLLPLLEDLGLNKKIFVFLYPTHPINRVFLFYSMPLVGLYSKTCLKRLLKDIHNKVR